MGSVIDVDATRDIETLARRRVEPRSAAGAMTADMMGMMRSVLMACVDEFRRTEVDDLRQVEVILEALEHRNPRKKSNPMAQH